MSIIETTTVFGPTSGRNSSRFTGTIKLSSSPYRNYFVGRTFLCDLVSPT